MSLKCIEVNNFTVFKKEEISFSSGINIIVGANGMGKTHLLKLLYEPCGNGREPDGVMKIMTSACLLPRAVREDPGAQWASLRTDRSESGDLADEVRAAPGR